MTLRESLEATDGWLSPKGEFYPCCNHEYVVGGIFSAHGTTALKIVEELYADEYYDFDLDTSDVVNAQNYLLNEGWLRIDLESIMGDYVTEYQKQALEKMLAMPDKHDGFCRKCAKKILEGDFSEPRF